MNSQPHNLAVKKGLKTFNIFCKENTAKHMFFFLWKKEKHSSRRFNSISQPLLGFHSPRALSFLALPSFSMQEPWGSSTVSAEEILSGLCFSFALSDAKTQTGRAWKKRKKKKAGWGGTGPTWQSRTCPPDLTHQMSSATSWHFGEVILKVNHRFLDFHRVVLYVLSAEWGGWGVCRGWWGGRSALPQPFFVFAVALSAPPWAPLSFSPLSPLFLKLRAGGEEWMTFSCLRFLCQKISKRHSSSLNGYNQSIPGHNKLGPIKS